MTDIVIMPGGFHPFHAGHMALYQSAKRAFPGAEVFVAATNDTSQRPFPFAIKEKLAKLAGVEPGHFVQVKSPFRAEEITQNFDPNTDRLIFVRSEKDADKPPQAGGVKKDGNPAYLQPLLGAKKLEPFARHAYMAYLPTVEFGPGMTSATEIRSAWPNLNQKRKTALVMSLYPATQKNPALAATVVKMLDTAIGTVEESTGDRPLDPAPGREFVFNKYFVKITPKAIEIYHGGDLVLSKPGDFSNPTRQDMYNARRYTVDLFNKQQKKKELARIANRAVEENQGWAATFTNEETRAYGGQGGAGMTATWQRKYNQPPMENHTAGHMQEKSSNKFARDPELYRSQQFAKQHYPKYKDDPEMAMLKLIQRSLGHSEEKDQAQDRTLAAIAREIRQIKTKLSQVSESDYIEEKWSDKYKRSINCGNPKGFSQRAHCAGRKKNEEVESQLDEKCWDTHRQAGMKKKGGRMVPNCVPRESA